jgi:predicted lactoylglutathione lyase
VVRPASGHGLTSKLRLVFNMSMNVICPVFVTEDVKKTVEYYTKTLGFTYADHIDDIEKFATIYRDSIEIILVEKSKGTIESNILKYGNGDDAYICPDSVEAVDTLYKEFQSKNVKIISEPQLKEYGSYEFQIEDIDGRHIGIGLINDRKKYFANSNHE